MDPRVQVVYDDDDPGAVSEAITTLERLVATTADDHPHRPSYLSQLAMAWWSSFAVTDDLDHLHQAIRFARAAAECAPANDPERPLHWFSHAAVLWARFQRTGSAADLDALVAAGRMTLDLLPAGDPLRLQVLSSHASALTTRGDPADRDELAAIAQELAGAPSPDDPDRLQWIVLRAGIWWSLFDDGYGSIDFDACVEALGAAADVSPTYLWMLADVLRARYRQDGHAEDLDRAVEASEAAALAIAADAEDRAACLFGLSVGLYFRFHLRGRLDDLDRAEVVAGEMMAVVGSSERHRAMAHLSTLKWARFDFLADEAALDSCVAMKRELAEQEHHDRAANLSDLCNALWTRYRRRGEMADLEQAVEAGRAAVAVASADDPWIADYLVNLSNALLTRFEELGDRADLDEAVDTSGRAVSAVSDARDHRALSMLVRSHVLERRAIVDADVAALDEAITASRGALELIEADHVHSGALLTGLSGLLRRRFELTDDPAVLAEAIAVARSAVVAIPSNRQHGAAVRYELGTALATRFVHDDAGGDADEAVSAWQIASAATAAPITVRMAAAQRWASMATSRGLTDSAVDGYAAAVALLPLLAWHGNSRHSRERELMRRSELAGQAAASAIDAGRPHDAVSRLEEGRAVLWSQLLQARGGPSSLRHAAPAISHRLDEIRRSLDAAP